MPKISRRQGLHPRRYIKKMFAAPGKMLYVRPSLYWCGEEIELEHFTKVLDYGENSLKLGVRGGSVTVTGDALTLTALEKGRVLLHGRFFKIEFSYE